MKISEVFRKRALFGVAIFCITAIATIGALSIGGNEEDNEPKSLVDLNETKEPEETQVADGHQENSDVQEPDIQLGEAAGIPGETQNPEMANPSQMADIPDETQNQTGNVPEQVALSGGEADGKDTEAQEPSQVADVPDETKEPEQAEVLSPQLIAEQLKFDKSAGLVWPISGKVVIPYSPDHGVFYQTLQQFSSSEAVVLSSAVGAEVKAAAKGVVTSIEEDVRTGTTITLALGNDTSLVYGQLKLSDLKEGDVVEAGECIGTVAEPTRYYAVEGPNLYFQVMEGEESIDPMALLQDEE